MILSSASKGRTRAEGNWIRLTTIHGRESEIRHVRPYGRAADRRQVSALRTAAQLDKTLGRMLTLSPWFTVGVVALCLVGAAVLYIAKDRWSRTLAVWGFFLYIGLGTAGLIYASSRHAEAPDALSGDAPQTECTESAHRVIVGLSIHNFISATFLGLLAMRRSSSKGARRRGKGLDVLG